MNFSPYLSPDLIVYNENLTCIMLVEFKNPT